MERGRGKKGYLNENKGREVQSMSKLSIFDP